MSWVVSPEWLHEVVFILGCGPSLIDFNSRCLRGNGRIIAINDSFLLAPYADVLYACDGRWWNTRKFTVLNTFTGRYMVVLNPIYRGWDVRDHIPGIKTLRSTGTTGLELDPGALRHGNNSGYQAINLAVHFGVTRIVLLGYDMRVLHTQMHWNDRPEIQNPNDFQQILQNTMLPNFSTLVEPLRAAEVAVVNATPNSALEVWPHVRLEEVLCNLDNKDFWKWALSSCGPATEVSA